MYFTALKDKLMNIKDFITTWGMIFLAVLMNTIGIYLIKLKMNEIGSINFESFSTIIRYFLQLISKPLAILGGVIFFIAPLASAIAMSKMELSIVFPLTVALSCFLIVLLSIFTLGESISISKIIAIILILIGIYLLYRQ